MQLHEALQMISGMTEAELMNLNSAVVMQINDRRNRAARLKRCMFKSGDKVSWTGRRGFAEGNIVRVKRKKAIVKVGSENWDVPLSMLQLVNS